MITPSTIITAELLASLDKCPFCGTDEASYRSNTQRFFKCGSWAEVGSHPVQSNALHFCQNRQLRARVQELEETNKSLHSLMVSGEKRGVEKATDQWSQRVKELESKVKRLTEAGDNLHQLCDASEINFHLVDQIQERCDAWTAAKEAK